MTALLLRHARVEDSPDPTDIRIRGGRIEAIGPGLAAPDDIGAEVLDCAGRVVVPGLIEAHLHPDKALLDGLTPEGTGSLADAIRITALLKAGFTYDEVRARAEQVLRMCVLNGTTAIRAHPDVDPVAGLTGLNVLLELRERWAALVTLQVVAFPQEGIFKAPGTEKLLREALDSGADVVGGAPTTRPPSPTVTGTWSWSSISPPSTASLPICTRTSATTTATAASPSPSSSPPAPPSVASRGG